MRPSWAVLSLAVLLLVRGYGSAASFEDSVSLQDGTSHHIVVDSSLKEVLRRVASNNAHMLNSAVPRLSHRQLTRAMQLGNMERLRVALSKMASGAPSMVAVVGGSITYGHGGEDSMGYAERLQQWLMATFPQGNVKFVNGGSPATDPSYMALCVNNHVPKEADIVFVEFATNDWPANDEPERTTWGIESPPRQNFERLLRRLLRYPNRPAVVLLNAYSWHNMPLAGKFWFNAEAVYQMFAQYYGLPSLSVRAAAYLYMLNNVTGYGVGNWSFGMEYDKARTLFYTDTHHPRGDTGHVVFADLAVAMLTHGLKSLAHRPVTASEEALVEEIPRPLMPHVGDSSMDDTCIVGPKLKGILVASKGFEWVNEGQNVDTPKLGFTGLTPGSWLELSVNTQLGMPSMEYVPVYVGHLRSYEHMGIALVECVRGCRCSPLLQNSHHHWKFSQTYTVIVHVKDQTPNCVLRISIQNNTTSGEHKVRVTSIMVSEATDVETLMHMSTNPSVGVAVSISTDPTPAAGPGAGR